MYSGSAVNKIVRAARNQFLTDFVVSLKPLYNTSKVMRQPNKAKENANAIILEEAIEVGGTSGPPTGGAVQIHSLDMCPHGT